MTVRRALKVNGERRENARFILSFFGGAAGERRTHRLHAQGPEMI